MAYIGLVGADEETLSAEFDAIIAGGRPRARHHSPRPANSDRRKCERGDAAREAKRREHLFGRRWVYKSTTPGGPLQRAAHPQPHVAPSTAGPVFRPVVPVPAPTFRGPGPCSQPLYTDRTPT